ncbi:MAG: LysR family transcriptional regulator [Proteobacteria bacterium]|nr:LysR family transcriptional regulator [Pseudomonadota bacterium]
MDFESLRAFIIVSDQRSFSLAAERLHLTQPAVSKRIALLEHHLGVKLFDRIGRTVNLTEAGSELYPRATEILSRVEDSKRAISNLAQTVSGNLSLATSHHIGLWRLPDVLKAYSIRYPGVSLDLHFMDSEVAHEQIVQGNLELGVITLSPTRHERLNAMPIWHDQLTFVCAANHPLAETRRIDVETLAGYPAILPDMSTFTGRIIKQMFDQKGLTLKLSMSTNYLETIKMLITVGLGWSVLPHSMLDESTCVLDVPDATIERTLGVIHHVQRSLSNAGRAFIDLLLENTDF